MTSTSSMSHEVIEESITRNDNGDIARKQHQIECKRATVSRKLLTCTQPFGPSIPTLQSIHNSSKSPLFVIVLSIILVFGCLLPLPIVAAENSSHPP